jgi:hypothetical protein
MVWPVGTYEGKPMRSIELKYYTAELESIIWNSRERYTASFTAGSGYSSQFREDNKHNGDKV